MQLGRDIGKNQEPYKKKLDNCSIERQQRLKRLSLSFDEGHRRLSVATTSQARPFELQTRLLTFISI